MKNKKRWLIPVTVILISTGLSILGADLALRLWGGKLLYYRPNDMFIEKWPRLPLVSRYKADVRYEGETFGDLAAMLGDGRFRESRRVMFETDTFGFCNSSESRLDETFDLIILGDSFGVGLGTTQDRTWAARLRERNGIRAYNLSMPGGSPWQGYVHFASEVKRLRHHSASVVLVTIFSGNDLDDYYYEENVNFSDLPWNNAWEALGVRMVGWVRRSPILRLTDRLRHADSSAAKVLVRELPGGRPMLFHGPYAVNRNQTAEMARNHKNYRRLLSTLRAIESVAADNGLLTMVVLFPSKEEVYDWVIEGSKPRDKDDRRGGLGVALEESCREDRIWFADLTPSLIEAAERVWKDSGDFIYWGDDTHWNEKGHGIVADIIHTLLKNHAATVRAADQ